MHRKGRVGFSFSHYVTGVKSMAQNGRLLLLAGVAGMRSMTQSGLHTFLPLYLSHQLGLSSVLVGLYLSVTQTAGMISTPLAGGLSDRSGRKPVLTAGMLSTSLILVLLAYFQITTLFVAALALLGFFFYAVRPVIWAWILDLGPKDLGGTTVSAFSAAQAIFSSLSPVICGMIADRWGILTSFYFLAGTILLANVFVFLIPEEQAKKGAPTKSPA